MKRTKFKFTIFALALVLIFSVAAFFAVNFKSFKPANAAGTVSVASNVFTQTNEASVVVDKQKEKDDNDEDKDVYYTMFRFGYDKDNISFRRNLAYSWYEGEYDEITEGEGDDKVVTKELKSYEHKLFNLDIGFRSFEGCSATKFIITFESQQYSKTEDGKTVNYIIFFPEGNDGVKVLITDDKDAEKPDTDTVLYRDHISINFVEA